MKFGYQLLEKPNIATLKSKEMDLLFYFVKNQDNKTGKVLGVHHKDVSASTGMVKQSFYSALKALEDKGIISYKRHNDGAYYTVTVLDNAFPDKESLSKGYIDLQKEFFYSEDFTKLKSHEKYLVLYFCKRTHEGRGSFHIYTKNLYRNLTKLFGVKERVVRSYLHSLRKIFSIGIKSGQYYITYMHSLFKRKIDKPERLVKDEGIIRQIVHKLKIRGADNEEISQTAELLQQYKNIAAERKKDLKMEIFNVISEIVSGILQKERNLQYKLINKLLHKRLLESRESSRSEDNQDDFIEEYERKSFEKLMKRQEMQKEKNEQEADFVLV